jgi:hypothetical protein
MYVGTVCQGKLDSHSTTDYQTIEISDAWKRFTTFLVGNLFQRVGNLFVVPLYCSYVRERVGNLFVVPEVFQECAHRVVHTSLSRNVHTSLSRNVHTSLSRGETSTRHTHSFNLWSPSSLFSHLRWQTIIIPPPLTISRSSLRSLCRRGRLLRRRSIRAAEAIPILMISETMSSCVISLVLRWTLMS